MSNELSNDVIIEEQIVKPNGDIITRKYSKGRFLGKGGFARCYEFTSLDTRKVYAAKIIAKSSITKARAKQKLMSEIKIHRSLKHPNIVGFEHFFEDAENVYILLELCTNQTLNELVKRRKRIYELEAQCYMVQIVNCIKYMHSFRVIHRDLKLGNLFLSNKLEIKAGDFGLATKLEFEGQKRRTICGTPNYIAPEILDGKQGHCNEVDIWSLGVVLYALIVGKPPFETNDVKSTYNRIRMNAYSFPDHLQISEQAKSLITRILRTEPSMRPTLDEIMEHPFFHMGYSIPKLLPASTLAVPPSESYLRQFNPSVKGILEKPSSETAPVSLRATSAKPGVSLAQTQRPNKLATTHTELKAELKTSQGNTRSGALGSPKSSGGPSLWVKKWVDYSSKYGLGYTLSNGSSGVFYNDSTKIIVPQGSRVFYYIERGSEKQEIVKSYPFDSCPRGLYKKVTLLQHFKSYLETDPESTPSAEKDNYSIEKPPPYVKKWMRTKRAILFRLSNKLVQVSFQDNTEVILSSEHRVVTYVNKQGERSTLTLSTAMESTDSELSKRLKYTKDILTFMVSGQGHTGGTTSPTNSKR